MRMKWKHGTEMHRDGGLAMTLACMMVFVCISTTGQASETPQIGEESIQLLEQTSQAFTRVGKRAIPSVVFITAEKTVAAAGPRGREPGSQYDFLDDELFRRLFWSTAWAP